RTGYLVGDPTIVAALTKLAEDTYISPGYVGQATTWEWCRRGLLEPQIRRLTALYGPRLEACLAAIDRRMPDARTTRPDGGVFLWVTLPEGVTNAAVREAAAARGLNLADGRAFFPDGGGDRFLRLPFCALSPAQIDEGIARLAGTGEHLRSSARRWYGGFPMALAPPPNHRSAPTPPLPDTARGDTIAEAPTDQAARVAAACARARSAQPAWAALSVRERARLLRRARREVVRDRSAILELLDRETGKARFDTVGELMGTCLELGYLARRAARFLAPRRVSARPLYGKKGLVVYVPRGVVGVISPWN